MKLNDADHIYFGSTANDEVDAVYIGSTQVWPAAAIVWELIPAWVGSLSVAASGGSATATWTLTGKRNGTTVYSSTVTPTSAQLGDSTNFHYNRSTGVWSADSRGTNGYTSSTTAPTSAQWSAQARDCTLQVNYSANVTVDGNPESVNVDSASQTMTQAANSAQYISSSNTYDQFAASLNRYNAQNSPAPASESTATASASCRCGNYIKWTSNASAYYYETISTSMFVFTSTASWITPSGNTITAASRGTVQDNNKRSATITAQLNQSYYPGITNTASATMWQDINVVTGYNYRNVSLSALTSNPATLICTTTQFTVSGTLAGDKQEVFSSTATSAWASFSETVYPTVTSATGAISFSGATVNIAANSTDSTKTITVGAKYTLNSTNYTASKAFTQGAVTYTYGLPIVTITYPVVSGQSYHIGAADGYVIPSVSFRQQRTNDVSGATTDITGTYTFGSDTSRQASDGSTFTVSFSGSTSITGASFNATSGRVDAPSRQTTTGSERNITTNAKATIVSHEQSGASSNATVKQRANAKGNQIPASCSSVVISSLSPSSINTCAATTVTATVLASWTEAGYKYTSFFDGDTTNGYTGLTPHNNESVTGRNGVSLYVNGSPVQSNTNQFSVNKVHSESTADHSVYANYMSVDSGTSYISQTPDSKSAWQYENYAVTLSVGTGILASGGTCSLVATGTCTRYKTWTDGARVDTENGVPFVPTSLTLENNPGTSIYWKTNESTNATAGTRSATLNHRDMMKVVTTDSVTVKAMADTQYDTEAVSVSNYLTNETVNGSWGTTYYQDHDYGVKTFTISDYTSQATEAPFVGAETYYTVVGSHLHTPYHDRSVYKKYTSWTSATDDDNHREYYTTETEQYGASTEDTTDQVLVTTQLSWVTINTTLKKLIFSAQTSGSGPRSGYVTATNANGGTGISTNVFQGGYASISRSPSDLFFPYSGGDSSFTVTWAYTTFTVIYSRPSLHEPLLTLSPLSGGSTSTTGSTTISVHCDQRDEGIEEGATGYVIVRPANAALSDQTVRVQQ